MRHPNIEPTSLSDAKYHLSLASPAPDAELLDELVRQFPEHADELTEFAIDLVLDATGEAEIGVNLALDEQSSAVSKAISRFHNRLYIEKRAAESRQPATNPFASMGRDDLRAFATGINANLPFVMKLRDRQIRADTIPDGFTRLVSEKLNIPTHLIAAHFAGQQEVRPGSYFKAEVKPEVRAKQSFEEAVRTSALTAEQQDFLLNL